HIKVTQRVRIERKSSDLRRKAHATGYLRSFGTKGGVFRSDEASCPVFFSGDLSRRLIFIFISKCHGNLNADVFWMVRVPTSKHASPATVRVEYDMRALSMCN